jgi:hypothetical protein
MSYEQPPLPDDLVEIVAAAQNPNEDYNVLDAAVEVASLGYFLAGTAKSQAIHRPRPAIRAFDGENWVQVFEDERPVLRATQLGGLAIACALFGDMNDYHQRRNMGDPLPEIAAQVRLSYSIEVPSDQPDATRYHLWCRPELIRFAQDRGTRLEGAIDILQKDSFHYFTLETDNSYSPFALKEQHTIASLPVQGPDLFLIQHIVPIPDDMPIGPGSLRFLADLEDLA